MNKLSFLKLILFLFILTGVHLSSLQADSLDVCINEIAWMGTDASSTDEWIELYNNTAFDIDLTKFTLSAEDGSPEILLSGIINASSYFLLERSDDNTVSDLPADLIYTGSLGNTGEYLVLRDSTDAVIDRVNCSNGWFGGNNTDKISMERISPVLSGCDSANWSSNNNITINGNDAEANPIKGTPGQQNSVYESKTSITPPTCLPDKIVYIYNYPNPFNPSTKIFCELSSENTSRQLSIFIFNLKGQKVRTLIKDKQIQGSYSLLWDGQDDRGRELPSGMYFLHLYSSDHILDTTKMIKLK